MPYKVLVASLFFLSVAVPVEAQSLTASGNVVVSATVPDLTGSPAQVIVPSMFSTVIPNVSANVTITNEGTEDYEYFYEWCVTTTPTDFCGSGNNIHYASASKLITVGQNWNTVLTSTVFSPGTYYFKTTVHFGSLASSASYQFITTSTGGAKFTPINTSSNINSSSSGGGANGAITGAPAIVITSTPSSPVPVPKRGDFTHHGVVDMSDFSVLLSYWGTTPPFKNASVDLNHDGKINAVDFSILLYLWGNATTKPS